MAKGVNSRERHVRSNSGDNKLSKGATCCACGRLIDSDPNYVVLIYRNRVMPAPAFYYYCEQCPKEEE